jgi:hypothetical protein
MTSNITLEGQNLRIRRGVIGVSIAIVLTVVCLSLDLPVVVRLGLFFPYLASLNLIFQGLFKT